MKFCLFPLLQCSEINRWAYKIFVLLGLIILISSGTPFCSCAQYCQHHWFYRNSLKWCLMNGGIFKTNEKLQKELKQIAINKQMAKIQQDNTNNNHNKNINQQNQSDITKTIEEMDVYQLLDDPKYIHEPVKFKKSKIQAHSLCLLAGHHEHVVSLQSYGPSTFAQHLAGHHYNGQFVQMIYLLSIAFLSIFFNKF